MQIPTLRTRLLPFALAACLVAIGGTSSDCLAGDGDTVSGWSFDKSMPTHFKDYGYEVVSAADGHPVRAGEKSIRFEIRAGDCGWTRGWNDCETDRERHELHTARYDTWTSGDRWYHWSIFFPEDHPLVDPALVILGQFHQLESHPVWLFHNGSGGYHVTNFTTGRPVGGLQRVLTDSEMRGKWTDVLIQVRWSDENDGYFRVWVNGEKAPRFAWSGPTKKPHREVYFRFGIYRAYLSRRPGGEPTQVVYFDEVKTARTCADVTSFFDCGSLETGQ